MILACDDDAHEADGAVGWNRDLLSGQAPRTSSRVIGQIGVVAAAMGLVGAYAYDRRFASRLATIGKAEALAWKQGDAEGALRLLEPLRDDAQIAHAILSLRTGALRQGARLEEAVDEVLALRADAARGRLSWYEYNTIVDILVSAGRYQDAIAIERSIPPAVVAAANARKPAEWGLVQINLAEADVNLGRVEDALARLEGWDAAVASVPLIATGLCMQRGWILALLGRGEEALAALAPGVREALGERFAAEYHLSHVFALLSLGRLDDAEHELDEASSRAVRSSTKRNVLFLRARLAFLRGDVERAERLCREAAEHPHRWQGADGLMLWADLCAKRGDGEGERHALKLVVERDPESVLCEQARARLSAMGCSVSDAGWPSRSVPARARPQFPVLVALLGGPRAVVAIGMVVSLLALAVSIFVLTLQS